ncbi:MAG: C-GCAxxG-C-C family protein, partial [Paludibacteraceae bacterium]|nr:C-GCAxxG-C-C family protein [Paludibacteraceae bacterium]
MRMMCGAVSGLVMLAGLDCGQTEGSDKEGKAACYKVVQDLLAKFKERNGSVVCAELLAMNGCKVVTDTNIHDERNAEYYKKRPCAKKVESAARVFAEYLDAKNNN